MNQSLVCGSRIPNLILEEIRTWLFSTQGNIRWSEMRIDLCYIGSECLCYNSYYRQFRHREFVSFEFDEDIVQVLESTLSRYFSDAKRLPKQQWNKARLEYQRGAANIAIQYKEDQDLGWLMAQTCEHDQLTKKVGANNEQAIFTWEGLPKDHPRPWLRFDNIYMIGKSVIEL